MIDKRPTSLRHDVAQKDRPDVFYAYMNRSYHLTVHGAGNADPWLSSYASRAAVETPSALARTTEGLRRYEMSIMSLVTSHVLLGPQSSVFDSIANVHS